MAKDEGKARRPRFVRVKRGRERKGQTAPAPEPQLAPPRRPVWEGGERARIVIPRQARDRDTPQARPDADIELREVRYGPTARMPYLRVVPRQRMFTRVAPGELAATEVASRPRDLLGRYLADVRRVVIGSPFATSQAIHERLTKVKALAILGSDPLSSSAYATEEMLIILLLAGSGALIYGLPIAGVIALLLLIVGVSYRQTMRAYPSGGGAYAVSQDNLGRGPSLLAASALLVDYVLLVSVSVAAGVAAITSALPELHDLRVPIGVVTVALITLGNLRGIRESGTLFAAPTYFFIAAMAAMIFVGLARVLLGDAPGSLFHGAPPREQVAATHGLTLFLVLRAFSSGSAALTGVEAMSNGVPTFKAPESTNARTTLAVMLGIAIFLFLGISYLASRFGVVPTEQETLVSALGREAFGENVLYYGYQVATALVLFLAANTSFNAFPLLSAILARDRFLPRQFTFKGDRLAFSNGILLLAGIASLLLVVFAGEVTRLIPLYATGVFVSFTLSQAGMVVHWWRLREPGWRGSLIINGVGATATGVVAVIIAVTKFTTGAWISILMMAALMLMFSLIRRHYDDFEEEVGVEEGAAPLVVPAAAPTDRRFAQEHAVVPVDGINRVTLALVSFARELSPRVTAVHVTDEREEGERLRERWQQLVPDVPLLIIESPYRAFVAPMLAYLESLQRSGPGARTTLVLPRMVLRHWWERFLHNQDVVRLKPHVRNWPNLRVVEFPYDLRRGEGGAD